MYGHSDVWMNDVWFMYGSSIDQRYCPYIWLLMRQRMATFHHKHFSETWNGVRLKVIFHQAADRTYSNTYTTTKIKQIRSTAYGTQLRKSMVVILIKVSNFHEGLL